MTTLTTVYLGRLKTSAEDGYVQIPTNDSAALVTDRADVDMWCTAAAFVGGRSSGTQPDVRIAIYDTDASKNPTTRVGYTAKFNPSTSMVGVGGGSLVAASIVLSDDAPLDTAIMIHSGKRYAFDILSLGHGLGVSVKVLDFPTIDNPRLYRRTAPGDPQPDPYASYSSTSPVGALTGYLSGHRNEAPEAPTGGLTPSGTVTDTAPIFTADFDDINGTWGGTHSGANDGDRMSHYEFLVTPVSDPTNKLWTNTYKATDAEVEADQVSRAYGGSVLTRGTAYQWKIRYSDQFGTWGAWSAWITFTPSAAGFVTLDSTPTGKVLDNTPDFNGRWNHQTAAAMTRVQVRIISKRGTVLQTGADYDIADVTSSALPGHLFTVPWANTGLATLSWGQSYQYQIRGKDATVWSDWSDARTFSTDGAPRIANHLAPDNSKVVGNAPTLTFTLTDPDDTPSPGSLVAYVEIIDPLGAATLDPGATYNSLTSKWELPVDPLILTAGGFGVYVWSAFGFDGTLYSGETTVLGSATQSALATFDYEAGPVVTVTSPANNSVIAAATTIVSWSVGAGGPQVKYRVLVYADDSNTIVYDSGTHTSTATSAEIPSGYLRNNTSYDIVVSITNGTPVTNNSNILNVSVAFTAPANVTNFQLDSVPIGNDPFDTANRLTWDASIYGIPDFQGVNIYRSADGGPDAARIVLAKITSPDTISFTDYTPASGFSYTYEISVLVLVGADIVESDTLSASATITLTGVVLTLMGNGGTYRACLLNISDLPDDRQIQEAVYQSPNAEKPVTVRSNARYWITSYAGKIINDSQQPADRRGTATAQERWDELDALDAQQGVVCVRDGAGVKRFGMIANLKPTRQKPDYYDVSFVVREESAQEGVTS